MNCQSWDTLFTLACLYDWQTFWAGVLAFAAGLLGFLAAIFAVVMTLRSEQRRTSREIDALKKGLGAEARYFVRQAYEGASALIRRVTRNEQIHIIDIENAAQFPSPNVYNGNSHLIGFLGDQTPQIVSFYNKLEVVQIARARLRRDIEPVLRSGVTYSMRNDLTQIVDPLIVACETAVLFLPALKTGTSLDDNDGVFPEKVVELRRSWEIMRPPPVATT
jgi:hypothetical protein